MRTSNATPWTINQLIAALTAIRDQHGNLDCRMTDGEPIAAVRHIPEREVCFGDQEHLVQAHVVISDGTDEDEDQVAEEIERLRTALNHGDATGWPTKRAELDAVKALADTIDRFAEITGERGEDGELETLQARCEELVALLVRLDTLDADDEYKSGKDDEGEDIT